MSGDEYLHKLDDTARAAYVMGVFDGMTFALNADDKSKVAATFMESCTKGWTSRQLAAVVAKYLQDHPENWNYNVAGELFIALDGVCNGAQKKAK